MSFAGWRSRHHLNHKSQGVLILHIIARECRSSLCTREKVTALWKHRSTPMLSHSPVPWKSDGKCSQVLGRLWREKVWVSSCFSCRPLFSSWSNGRGLLRPAVMVDVIRFLFPGQTTPYCSFSDSIASHTHPIFMSFERWEMQDGTWQGHPTVLCQ